MPAFAKENAIDTIVVGHSGPLEHTLWNEGATFDATGFTIAIDIEDKNGDAVAGITVSWANELASRAQIENPDILSDSLSPYTWRWKVTDGVGDVQFYPGNTYQPNYLYVVPVHPEK